MSEIPSIGSAELLANHRKRSNATLIRAKVAEKLRRVAGWVAEDRVKAGSPTAAFVVLLVPDVAPVVTWAGEVDWDDLRNASNALQDANLARYGRGREDDSIQARVEDGWRSRQHHKAWVAQKQVNAANEKPWQCEHCERRYKTQRGAEQHERGCVKNPRARQYQPGGGYRMFTRDDGTFAGFERIPDDG